MQNLQTDLIKLLEKDERFTKDGKLLKNNVIEAALQLDPSLLKLLLSHKSLKKYFFQQVEVSPLAKGGETEGVLVFDKIEFQKFVSNKSFLKDSYTAYSNKIGLTSDDEFISEGKQVVLSWPYKDCVLEGGQTKDDEKRDEIFWNETLAPDEIDRLLSPKVFTNFKKYDKKGEHGVTDISFEDNLIIKGNNLLALYSLLPVYRGQIKLIYIDPPYNTGNDSFLYNDSFNKSTWLTFMKNRLEIARELLSKDGTIAISIDNNEIAYLLILMDEIFNSTNRKNIITIKRGSVTGAKVINPGVVNVSEYLVMYSKDLNYWKPNRVYQEKAIDERYNTFIVDFEKGHNNWQFTTVLDAFSKSLDLPKNKLKKTLGDDYQIKLEEFIYNNPKKIIRFASLDENSISQNAIKIKRQSVANPNKVFFTERENSRPYFIHHGQLILFLKDRLINFEGKVSFASPVTDIWDDVLPNDLHNEGGITLRKGKKPEKLIARLIEMCTKEKEIVLDFFVGSGTTAAVAQKMNRHYIAVEQLDYIEDLPLIRLKNTIDGEQSGISKTLQWQGGGSFIYFELCAFNKIFVNQVKTTRTTKELKQIWETIKNDGFIIYKVNPNDIDNSIKEFEELSLADQKKFLIAILDKNHLYVNYSEIDDKDYKISAEDKKLNKKFYSLK